MLFKNKIISAVAALVFSVSAFAQQPVAMPNDIEAQLSEYSQDITQDLENRVNAIIELGRYGGVNSLVAIGRASRAEEKELRMAAIQAVANWKGNGKWDVVSPLLNDSDRDVRGFAGYSLVSLWSELHEGQRKHVDDAVEIYLEDNLKKKGEYSYLIERGLVSFHKGDIVLAEKHLLDAKDLDDSSDRAYIVLSKVYNYQQDKHKVVSILEEGIVLTPDSALLYFTAGLAHVRYGNDEQSEKYLKMAATLEPESERYLSTYAARISKTSPIEASEYLFKTAELTGREEYKSAACGVLLSISKEKADLCIFENLLEK